jgi:HK97 family phage major capsid protein
MKTTNKASKYLLPILTLQHFAGMSAARFEEIKKLEVKELFNLDRKELEQAASMGETRCESVVKELELDELRKYKQQQEVEKAAAEQAQKIADEIINTTKQVDNDIEEKVNRMVEQKLQESGVNIANKYTRRLVEQKMHNDAVQKNFMVNGSYGRQALSPAMKDFVNWAKTGETMMQKAALVGTTPANGGYLVPDEFHAEVLRKMSEMAIIRKAGARVITMSGDKMTIPTLATEGTGGWKGKAQGQAYKQEEPTFSEITLEPKKYDRLALASYEMLEDSAINVADLLADIFAEDFAIAEDNAFISGDGATMPEGIITSADVTLKALIGAAAGTIEAQDVFNIVYALKRKYRQGASWLIHDTAVSKLRGLEVNGSFLWSEGNLANGEPARLAGYPVYTSDALELADFDGAGAGAGAGSPLVFGNLKYYYIGDRQGFRLRRSTERYFETGQVAFAADKRVDGKVALGEGFVKSGGVKH